MTTLRLGIIGDLHTHWDYVDIAQFADTAYDLLFFTGDLGGGTRESSLNIARVMSRLRHRVLVMPGNNDTFDIEELAAELTHRGGLRKLAAMRSSDPGDAAADERSVNLCGYSTHRVTRGDVDVTFVAARPHSLGGPELSFPEYMSSTYGIDSMDASTQRMRELVDQVETRHVIFLAHNGPTGHGDEPDDMWGCDFKPGGGDWGDPDLAAAIDHARGLGKVVQAVIAGHMHLNTKCGRVRPWRAERDGILYVNAARVPRIFEADGDVHRHHVALTISRTGVDVEEVLVPESAD